MSEYKYKLDKTIAKEIQNLRNSNILEFGVRKGISTRLFLDHANKTNCKLYSVDNVDYSTMLDDKNWKFIKDRDDNFDNIKKQIPSEFDLIYLDTLHEAEHVKKIIYNYFNLLTQNGTFIIDDISHLPYLKNSKRTNFYCEINNLETFKIILEIYNNNQENFDLSFSFIDSGNAILKRKTMKNLNPSKKIVTREYSFKNFIRQILLRKK